MYGPQYIGHNHCKNTFSIALVWRLSIDNIVRKGLDKYDCMLYVHVHMHATAQQMYGSIITVVIPSMHQNRSCCSEIASEAEKGDL